jgi:precorrin-2 dehydrogenase/sirohydrochlorin ferrochelatase
MPNYYPIMLDVREQAALVIGGDRVAAEKARNLSLCGARVTVMGTTFCAQIHDLEQCGAITVRRKAYATGDLAGYFVVITTTTHDPALSERIWNEAQERGLLINIVDVPTRCNFILPSILQRGQLTIAVSTEGTSPSLAKRIRQRLEGDFPTAYATYLQLASIARAYTKEAGLSYKQRDDFFHDFFASEILELLIANDQATALAQIAHILQQHNVEISEATILNTHRSLVPYEANVQGSLFM